MSYYDFKEAARLCDKHAKARDRMRKHLDYEKKQREQRKLINKAKAKIGNNIYLDLNNSLRLTDEFFLSVQQKRYLNEQYADYYQRLYEETNNDTLANISQRVMNCNYFWYGDDYPMQRVFDVKRVSLCHDKFCANCQHLKQAVRLMKFTPLFENLRNDYSMYHLTLTVPNVNGIKLKSTISDMYNAFKKLIRYLSGDAKIRGVDFSQYGYAGAIRCLEITMNLSEYHPHIHCLLLLKKDLQLTQYIKNKYSYSNGVLVRMFSDLEIAIQKIWCLAFNGLRVDLKSIDNVPDGYSCTLDEVNNNEWHEVFKYVTKLSNNGNVYPDYEQFKTLYYALYNRRIMQSYGVLYGIDFDDDTADDEVLEQYTIIQQKLQAVEEPTNDWLYNINDISHDVIDGRLTVISKKNVTKYLNELAETENALF